MWWEFPTIIDRATEASQVEAGEKKYKTIAKRKISYRFEEDNKEVIKYINE